MIHILAFLLYIGAFLLWIRVLLAGPDERRPLVPPVLVGVAVVVHGFALVEYRLQFGELPLVGPGAALSSLAFVGGLALLATLPLREVARVAIVLLPFIIVVQGIALAVGIHPAPTALDFQGAGFILHVAFAFLGYQALALAGAAGILYLVQHHELKEKRMGRFFHFIPPLGTLDRVGLVGLWVGFGSLTLALAFGWAWTLQNPGALALSDAKVLWALLSWVVFVGALSARVGEGRTEYRGAVAAVVGFAVVIAVYVILRLTAPSGTGLFL